jgi:LuxR family transcriptional regulator, maltose regulon positive regulatory protein
MPKAAPYSLRWNLSQGTYTLYDTRGERELPLDAGDQVWFDWLASIPSFTFSGRHGRLTVRQETRSGGIYWYAYRRVGERMVKRYLGRTTDLTPARLEEVAAQVAEAVQRAGQETHAPAAPTQMPAQHAIPSPIVPPPLAMAAWEAVPPLPQRQHDVRLATKLHVPRLRPLLVHRNHLITRLQQGMEAPLTLISAPAGFGKTTLLCQWLSESGRDVAWLSLEPEDNEPMRFLSSVIAALQTLDPHLCSNALALLHTAPPAPPPPPEAVLAQLAADLLECAHRDLSLVLDDYHVITNEALQRAVAALLEHPPPHLRLVIATRADPALPLARLRVRGHLCEVRAVHLQFSTEEAGTFLETVMGLNLEPSAVVALHHRTEGWIAGLQLAALSLQGRVDVQQFLVEFSGSHRHIVDYLVEEVLTCQPLAVQSFLVQTSILARLTGALCDAVTGRTGSEALLEHLEHANLFLVPLDEQRQWYRYHHLFAEVLRARLSREVETAGLAALYTRASAWYKQNGMLAEAVEAALSAGDFVRAARLIDLDSPLVRSMLGGYEARTLIGWLDRFPHQVLLTNAHLCLVYAWALFSSETSDAHKGPLAVAEQLLQAEGNRTGLGLASTLQAFIAAERGDGAQAIKYGDQALQLLPENAMHERSAATSALAEGYRLTGEVKASSQMVTEARPLHEQTGDVGSLLADTLALGDLLTMQGRLHEAAAVYEAVQTAALPRQSYAIRALLGLGNNARERNELDAAEAHLGQAVTLASKIGDRVMLARAETMRARAIQARGDAQATREAWASALSVAHACSYLGLVEQAQAYQVHGWLQQGRIEEAIRWQQACPLTHDAPPNYQHEVVALTLVRVLLAQRETGEALRLLDRWHRHARAQGRTGSEIELLVLSALAHAELGKTEQAVQLLRQALLRASPEGYVRVFVDEGGPMAVLLHMVLSRWKGKSGANEVHRLLAVVEVEQRAQGSFPPVTSLSSPPLEPLSTRERKVLHLLAAGLSNAEIAAELVVSINTIRTQARSIYHKLNVKNRHEAVALARQWQLL